MRMRIQEIEAKSVLVESKLPDADYVVNPYTGCQFGCLYCYASFMGRFVNEPLQAWGNYVYVKANAVQVFEGDLARLPQSKRQGSILLSSVTDPYHGPEAKYKLTRGILEVLAREQYPGRVGILTKSPLVLRDVDILKRLTNTEVGLTITTTDDAVSRTLEVRAPVASKRLQALERLSAEGLETYAFIGPLLPHFRVHPELLDGVFARLAAAGVKSVFIEHMNMKPYIMQRLRQLVDNEPDEVQEIYRAASTTEHRVRLDEIISELLARHNLGLRLSQVLYHNVTPLSSSSEKA